MMLGRTLIESVPYGTVFLTVGQHYIDGGSFYVPMALDKAIEAFIDELNASGQIKLTHKPEELIDELIKRHGLVIVNKKSSAISPSTGVKLKGPGTDYFYQINGIDGYFTLDQIKAFISRGVIKPNTGIKVSSSDYADVSDYTPAAKISSLTPLFTTLTEPDFESAQATIVANNPGYVKSVMGRIQDYFDLDPDQPVLYSQSVGKAIKGDGNTVNINSLEKKPKRA